MLVTFLAMAGIASFALPTFLAQFASFHSFFLNDTVRGLLGLVVLFNVYVVYEQVQVNRIRKQVAEEFYKLVFLDPLTGLFNRRYIEQWLTNEIARSQRHGSALAVVIRSSGAMAELIELFLSMSSSRANAPDKLTEDILRKLLVDEDGLNGPKGSQP